VNAADRYLRALQEHLLDLADRERGHIEDVAERIAESIADGGIVHVFGTGHSQLVALEVAERAAGLAPVNAIAPSALAPVEGGRAAATERLHGYGEVVLDGEDLRTGEVLIVVSNSGINPVPVEVAAGAAKRGLFVVAVTSRSQSHAAPARERAGRRLHELADLTIDTGTPAGDAAVELGDGTPAGPLSTVLASAALHAVLTRAAELIAESGEHAPILRSQNLSEQDLNRALFDRYASRTGRRP
jgi:uncharacterized phosphosugar-binding protein